MKIFSISLLTIMFYWSAGGPAELSAAGFFDSFTKTLDEAGDVIIDTSDKLAKGVKEVGKDLGVLEGDDKKKESTVPATSTTGSDEKESESGAGKAVVVDKSTKLPGGVTSRIKKTHKELDKAEQGLAKGNGGSNRVQLSLQRAAGYMDEIEKRYSGQYSPDHPDVQAAMVRLEEVTGACKKETGETTGKEEKVGNVSQAGVQMAAAPSAELCKSWDTILETYAFGEKNLNCYPTKDEAQIKAWQNNYNEAKAVTAKYRSDVTEGSCFQADSSAKLIAQKMEQFEGLYGDYEKKKLQAIRDKGRIIFSTSPFAADGNGDGEGEFFAGDNIYGLIEVVKPWSEIYGKKKDFFIRVDVLIDGKKIHAQFVKLKNEQYTSRNYLIFEVAPEVEKMTAYSDTNIEYGKSTPTIIQGPNELSHHLAQLSPGKHKVDFQLKHRGKLWAQGDFTIQGNNYHYYRDLHKQIAEGVVAARVLPAAKMTNKKYEEEMTRLLLEAGWKNVYRLNIVDKNWWLERVSGGNSPISSRYLGAVALTEDPEGTYYYKKCLFHQDKLITGGFGAFYISHQGKAVEVPKANIDK